MQETILTGIRTNSTLTLGNYCGAIAPMLNLHQKYADVYNFNFFIPDLHSFTTYTDYSVIKANSLKLIKIYLALGLKLDNSQTIIYRQSQVGAHSKLTVILNNFVYWGELNRMTQFKDKSAGKKLVSAGLFDYPVLMAADILLYDAKYVPVGEDQRQHLELTRDIAYRINKILNKNIFNPPATWSDQLQFTNNLAGLRIRSLSDPARKMSKSIPDPNGTILLSDQPDQASNKIMQATTDSLAEINFNYDTQPGISNLLAIQASLKQQAIDQISANYLGQSNYKKLKQDTAEVVFDFLKEFQAKFKQISDQDVISLLTNGEKIANLVANKKLTLLMEELGLNY